jgi:hypothetical protein
MSSTAEVVLNLTVQEFSVQAGEGIPTGTVIPIPSYKRRGWAFRTDAPSVFIGALAGTVQIDEDGEPNPNFGLPPEVVLGAVHRAATEYLRARGIDRVPELARWSGSGTGRAGQMANDFTLDKLDPKRELRDTTLPA